MDPQISGVVRFQSHPIVNPTRLLMMTWAVFDGSIFRMTKLSSKAFSCFFHSFWNWNQSSCLSQLDERAWAPWLLATLLTSRLKEQISVLNSCYSKWSSRISVSWELVIYIWLGTKYSFFIIQKDTQLKNKKIKQPSANIPSQKRVEAQCSATGQWTKC